jgi:predicted MPP superfamily phosphohydrolase
VLFRSLLAHQPNSVIQAAEAGFDIQISGHTHGGQIFPWNHFVALNQPFLAGLYSHNGVRLYVSRGTGYWGPPMRFLAPSEITRIILAPA